MADFRTDAYSIYINESDKAKLSAEIGGVIENYEKRTISSILKAKNGTPQGRAAMIYKRFVNANSQAYGTARAAGAGNKVIAPETIVNLDEKEEIIEEVNKFDLETFGVAGLAERRKANFRSALNRIMERAFFLAARGQGTQTIAINVADVEASIEARIQELETLQNDYVDGVERDQMAIVLKPSIYGLLKNKLNDMANTIVTVEGERVPAFNGVATYSSTYLPAGVDAILMVYEAIAQPLVVDEYGLDKIPLSNNWALELFYDYGIKALAPDLIWVAVNGSLTSNTPISSLGVVATVDGADVTGVDGYHISVPVSTTTTAIEFQLNRAVALVGSPVAKVTIAGVDYDYGTVALKSGDNTSIIVTPSGTNGQSGSTAGVTSLHLPANSLTTVDTGVANAKTLFVLTVTA